MNYYLFIDTDDNTEFVVCANSLITAEYTAKSYFNYPKFQYEMDEEEALDSELDIF